MATLFRVSMTAAEYAAYIAVPTNIVPNNYTVLITDAPTGAPNLYTGLGTNTPASGTSSSGSGGFNNLSATSAPTVTDDSGDGYNRGSRWIDTVADESYICLDNSAGAAVWVISTADTISNIFGLQTALDTKEPKVTGKGLSTNDYTTTEKNKLAGVATAATANDTDANLKNRANHTGSQAQSTITNLTTDLGNKAPSVSPAFTGTPTSVTPAVDTNTTQIATTAFVNSQLSGTLPVMDGTATVGSDTRSARGNHIHPTDTSREAAANKNVANGYAGLDASSKVPTAQLPSLATTMTTSLAPILGANIGLPGYRRSKLIPVNSTTTGTGDYQVEIAVGESALSVGATFHLGGNSQDFPAAHKDSGEFAFVKPDGTAIPFWVAEVTGTAPNRTARVYLRMPGLTGQAASVQSLVFMLYDNNVMSVSPQMAAIDSVFNLLADDFDGAAINNGLWVSTGITTIPSGSVLTFGGGNTARLLDSVATFGDNTEILSRFTFTTTNASTSQFGYRSAVSADTYAVGDVWDTNTSVWVGATRTDLTTGPDATSRLYRLRRNAGAGVFTWWNGTSQITQNSTSIPTVATPVRGWNTYDNSTSIDWIAIRQILAVPPTIGTISDV